MRRLSLAILASAAAGLLALAATPASAQYVDGVNPGHFTNGVPPSTTLGLYDRHGMDANAGGRMGLDPTTPSRIRSSRREMNRGRRGGDNGFERNMSASQTRDYAERVIRRAGFICSVLDAQVVAQSNARAPLVEVDCQQGGGLILADTTPIQATDCLDIPEAGIEIGYYTGVAQCRLPGNVASVALARGTAPE